MGTHAAGYGSTGEEGLRLALKAGAAPRRPSLLIQALADTGRCEFPSEGDRHLELLSGLVTRASVRGGQVHDARIAAICIAHGVREFWSADRDFSRYPALRVVNPLASTG